MSRWIEEKWLNKRIKDSYRERIGLDSAPSIEVVMCKECKYWEMRNSPRGWCVVHQGYVSPQYYCADGEREGE